MCWQDNHKVVILGEKKVEKTDRERLIGFCSQPEEVLWSWTVEFIGKWRPHPVALEINRRPPTGFSVSLFSANRRL